MQRYIKDTDIHLDMTSVDINALEKQTEYLLKRLDGSNGAVRKTIWSMLKSKLELLRLKRK